MLRFSGFTDEWNEVKLGDISTFLDNKRIPLKEDNRKQIKGEYPYYGASGIIDYVNDYIFDEELILMGEDGANIVTRSSKLIFLAKGKYWVNNHAHVIKADNNINQYFLSESLERINYEKYNTGTAQPKLNREVCQKIKVKIPQFNEQNKIANFLLVIDEKLRLLEQKYQYYQNFKKYLMQQIFTQKLRFDKTSEWETFALNDIGKTYNGLSGLSKDNFEKGNSKYITYKSIFDNNILKSDFTENVDLNNKSQNEVKKGDLFFTGSSETPEEVGMVSVLSSTVEDCYLNSFCFGFRLNNNYDVNPLFLAYYLRSPIMRNKIMILAQGSTRFNLSKKEILKLKVEIPSISEQQQIIDLFQNVDNKINEISIQTDNFNKFKKGLLQQMFDNMLLFKL